MRALVAVALIAFAVCADPAAAQQVVGGTPPGATLAVADVEDAHAIELTLGAPDADEPAGRATTDLNDAPPLWPDEAVVVTLSRGDAGQVVFGGAVEAAAAAVELRFADGHVVRAATFAGEAYTGLWAGRLRFVLGETTIGEGVDGDPVSVRMLDAAGAVIGVERSPVRVRSARVLTRRAGGALVRMTATVKSELAALPGAPEHRKQRTCVDVDAGSLGDVPEVACQDAETSLQLGGLHGCGRVPSVLTGFVPDGTRRLDVTLGSGRTVAVPARPLPFGQAGRMVAATLPAAQAIRGATAVAADGRVLARGALLVAPPDRRCDPGEVLEDWRFDGRQEPRLGVTPETQVAATLGAGPPRLLIRDAGERICAGIDRLELDDDACIAPPFSAHDTGFYADLDRGLVAAVYPAAVAEIEISFRDGTGSLRVPAVAGAGYTGRYRDDLHFVFARVPAGRPLGSATLFDAAGRTLAFAGVDGPAIDPRLTGPLSTVLRAGPARVLVGAWNTPEDPLTFPCLTFAIGRERGDCLHDWLSHEVNTVEVRVPCERRRTVVFGIARRGVRRVELVLSGGRRVRARLAPFTPGQHVYLALAGRRDAVSAVHFLGGPGAHRFSLPRYAPSRQCGYASQDELR
jgi:hypothetical protein